MTSEITGPPTKAELAAAEPLVASRDSLWAEFVDALRRHGTVRRLESGWISFMAGGESSVRTFAITAEQLRMVLLREAAFALRAEGRSWAYRHLPPWLLDEIWEFVGSFEEPYDAEFVIMDERGKLCPSPVPPGSGA